jgi:hypothetical protein
MHHASTAVLGAGAGQCGLQQSGEENVPEVVDL